MFDYLIVGAGFAGSVLAERLANGSGKKVLFDVILSLKFLELLYQLLFQKLLFEKYQKAYNEVNK